MKGVRRRRVRVRGGIHGGGEGWKGRGGGLARGRGRAGGRGRGRPEAGGRKRDVIRGREHIYRARVPEYTNTKTQRYSTKTDTNTYTDTHTHTHQATQDECTYQCRSV